jgi:amino acid transporter
MSHVQPNEASEPVEADESIARRDAQRLRHGRLGAIAIAFFVISAAAPLTGMAGGAPFAMLLGNGTGVPVSYLLVTLLMLAFSVGYVAMARHHTSTGAFYAYVSKSMGGHAGGAAALVALLGYNTMQIGLYGLFGVAASGFISVVFSVTVSWWVLAFAAMAVIAVLGYRQVDLSLKILAVLVAGEFLIVMLFDLLVLVKGGGGGDAGLNVDSFTWDSFSSGTPAIGLLFAAASFVGFEATTIYSEEARDPKRTVPRATYIAVLTIGIFFMVTSWLMVNAYGGDDLVAFIGGEELGGPTNFLFAMAQPYIGDFLTNKVMLFLFASSLFAALLAFHNAVARYTYALGREGLVPERLGRTHPVHLSPHAGSLSQTALAAVVVGYFALADLSPDAQLFTWLTQLGTLAISYLMAFAALAVLVFFVRNPGLDNNVWRTKIAPAVGMFGLLAVAGYATWKFSFLIGSDNALKWVLPALIPLFAVVGVISAALLRKREPEAFALMGRHRDTDGGVAA